MRDVHETLLYIAYNLQNQGQVITFEAIRQSLRLMQNKKLNLVEELKWLILNGFLSMNSKNQLSLTEIGKTEVHLINKIRAKEDFNRLICHATDSITYLDFCAEIYGCRMYLFNMMDKQQLDYLFNTILVSGSDTILDLGCGTGAVLDNLVRKYDCQGIGIDQLKDETVKKCSKMISYIEGDIDALSDYKLKPNITVSVDGLYFSSNLDKLIRILASSENNRLYLFYSQYIFDERTKDKTVLHRDNTRLAKSLQKNKLQYKVIEYSTNEHSLYENALKVLPKYKNAFQSEGNIDLYETKMREYKSGHEMYNNGLASRYLYVVE